MMEKLSKIKTLRITETQHNTLVKIREYNVDICDFIRNAISEKIKREYSEIIESKKDDYCPF